MKKILLIIVALFITGSLFAQLQINSIEIGSTAKQSRDVTFSKTPTDTVFIDDYFTYVVNNYNYIAPGLGYILGPHWDTAGTPRAAESAQGYFVNPGEHYGIENVLIWTARKSQVSPSGSDLYVNVASLNGASSYTVGGTTYNITCPGTVLGRDTIVWNDIDTSGAGWTVATYNPPIYVDADYSVVFNVSDFYANDDTLSIIGGDPVASSVYGLEYTFYHYPSPSLWTQFSHIWTSGGVPIEMAIAMFPVIDINYVNVGDAGYANHMQLSQNSPNPSNGITSIEYALEVDANVLFELYDYSGKKLVDINEGHKCAGTYTLELTTDLAPGIYFYSLIADGKRLTKKMCIE